MHKVSFILNKNSTYLLKPGHSGGYTIIETMIAISLFLVVVFSGLGALLNMNLIHQKSEDMRSIMDNLSFILEDISRNLRTGYNYRCYPSGTWGGDEQQSILNVPQSCDNGGVIVFEETHGNDGDANADDQWVYKVDSTDGVHYNISKSVDGGLTFVQLNIDEVSLTSGSGFSVLGAEAPPGNEQQPFVIIKLMGEITYKDIVTPFSLETAVSQRLIDI